MDTEVSNADILVLSVAGNEMCRFTLSLTSQVREVKQQVEKLTGMYPAASQKLLLGTDLLYDTETLEKLCPRDNDNSMPLLLTVIRISGVIVNWLDELAAHHDSIRSSSQGHWSVRKFFQDADVEIRDSFQCALEAVRIDGDALEFAASDLKANRQLAVAAVQQTGLALRHVDEVLRDDREIVMAAIESDGIALGYVNEALRSDVDIVMLAIKRDGLALRYVNEALRNDRDVVFAAVKNNGLALSHASSERRGDRKLVVAAIRQNPSAFEFAAKNLKSDLSLWLVRWWSCEQRANYGSIRNLCFAVWLYCFVSAWFNPFAERQ